MFIESPTIPGTILVVEDESVLLDFVRLVLARAGYTILTAQDGEEAWSVFNTNRKEIRLVLTDIVMPGSVDGLELSARLQRRAPEIPVLFMSGALPSDDSLARELVNKRLLLRKPFNPDQLLAIVRERLSGFEVSARTKVQS
jgi:DNA-binding response OmpR family regulator